MIHCDRTVGHTLVFSAVHSREPCPGDEATTAVCRRTRRRKQPLPHRRELSDAAETNPAPRARASCKPHDQSVQARRLLSTRRPVSAWASPRHPPGYIEIQGAGGSDCRYDEAHNNNALVTDNRGDEAGATACGAQTPGRCRQASGAIRPHTALGMRGVRDQPDLFDARAADPGWGSTGVPSAARPLSAPERDSWKAWSKVDTSCGRPAAPPQTLAGSSPLNFARTYRPRSATHNERRKTNGVQSGANASEDGSEYSGNTCFFGRTLLAEAKLLVDGGAQTDLRCRTKVTLKCSSLDGLMRQQSRVRKTLLGFVVEASIAARPLIPGQSGDRVCSSSSVAVSAVQDFLETAARNIATNLAPFREALPLDDRGNYTELTKLMGKAGQRELYQTLLESCRVITAVDGAIGVELLRARMSATTVATIDGLVGERHDRAHRANFPRPRRPEAAKRAEPSPAGAEDKVRRAGAVRGSGAGAGSDKRHSDAIEYHGGLAASDGGASSAIFFQNPSGDVQGVEEGPPVVDVQSPSVHHTAREVVVAHNSESEIYETLSVEEEEGEDNPEYESDFS